MRIVDRLILGGIGVGIWTGIAMYGFAAGPVHAVEDDGLRSVVSGIVENCRVTGTVSHFSGRFGDLREGVIRCP